MKNTLYYLLPLLMVLLVGCSDRDVVENTGAVRIIGGLQSSRTTFVEDNSVTHVVWKQGDVIGLFANGQENVEYGAQSSASQTEFKALVEPLEVTEGSKVTAYYPYRGTGGNPSLPYSSFQSYKQLASDLDFIYASGTVKGNEVFLQFKHVFAFLKITLKTELLADRKEGGLFIRSTSPISYDRATFDFEKETIVTEEWNDHLFYSIPDDVDFGELQQATFYVAVLPQPEGSKITVSRYDNNSGGNGDLFLTKNVPSGGFKAGHVYTVALNENQTEANEAKERAALTELYQLANGSNWTRQANWCTDKPLSEWAGVCLSNGRVLNLYLSGNNLSGTIPESLGQLSNLEYIDLSGNEFSGTLPQSIASMMDNGTLVNVMYNNFSGTLPDAIVNHPRWKDNWLGILPQGAPGGLQAEDVVIPAPEFSVTDLDGNTLRSSEVYAASRLTVIYCWYPGTWGLSDEFMKLYDYYKDKGLGVIGHSWADENELKTHLQANPQPWKNFCEKYDNNIPAFYYFGRCPSFIVVDNETNQVVYYPLETGTEGLYGVLKKYFGAMTFYTSSDYSKDGEVVTLQEATVGNGIDLVLMGEGFVDRDMESGGAYEQHMRAGMEQLFSVEPYTALRNRFNVYAVKVVSPNAEFMEGAEQRIYENNNLVFEYAKKAPVSNPDLKMCMVLYNTKSYVGRSHCTSYSDGSFVAYVMDVPDETVNHEVGGHGIGRLLDEYVESGNESLTLPDDRKNFLDEAWSSSWSWFGANVDYRSNPDEIKWAHLLKDSRYAGETGIIEGSYLYGYGAYRSSENSMMRYNIPWFNAPSREHIYKMVMSKSEGEGWSYDFEQFAAFDEPFRGGYDTRSVVSEEELRERMKRHKAPVFIPMTWREAMKRNPVVPYR